MLGFGRGSSVEVVINRVPHLFDQEKILSMVRENTVMMGERDRLAANHDEMARRVKVLEDRLAAANAKLKEYGNPGLF